MTQHTDRIYRVSAQICGNNTKRSTRPPLLFVFVIWRARWKRWMLFPSHTVRRKHRIHPVQVQVIAHVRSIVQFLSPQSRRFPHDFPPYTCCTCSIIRNSSAETFVGRRMMDELTLNSTHTHGGENIFLSDKKKFHVKCAIRPRVPARQRRLNTRLATITANSWPTISRHAARVR